MRIISGKYKGRLIKMPKGIRPTQDKVRKALFDILGDIEGLSFLELFAGSGAVGLEAASRGAKKVIFVEKDWECLRRIQEVLSVIRLSGYPVIRSDAIEAIKKLAKKTEKFDIIFMDPPYYGDLAKKTLQSLEACDILARSGLIIVQHFKKDDLPETLGVLSLFRQSRYGDTILSFYRKPCAK
jgi:16S rRNA (guanine(966)-N(2))-methyltransferase RsmD